MLLCRKPISYCYSRDVVLIIYFEEVLVVNDRVGTKECLGGLNFNVSRSLMCSFKVADY